MKHSKKMCFPGDGKSDRLVGKELTVFVRVFVCLLELLVFNLLITRSCCLLGSQIMRSSFVGQWYKRKPCPACR